MPSSPAYRTLGLTVPITDLLDAKKWRRLYAAGVVLGRGDGPAEVQSPIDTILGCGASGQGSYASAFAGTSEIDKICEGLNELNDDVIRWQLRAAASELEVRLSIPLGIVVCKGAPVDAGQELGRTFDVLVPRKTYSWSNARQFYKIDLPAGVISVERVRAFWYDVSIWEAAPESIVLENSVSTMHLLPAATSTGLMIPAYGAPGYAGLYRIGAHPSPLPAVWSVDYTLGPRSRYGAVGTIEAVLAHWVYCKAAPIIFGLAAQAATGGITSSSLSLDGLSKSVSLPAGLYDALIKRFTDAEASIDWKSLKVYKKGLRIVPYGA